MNRRVGTTLGDPLSRAPRRFRKESKGPFLRKARVAPSNHNFTQPKLNHPTQAHHHLRQQMDLKPGVEHSLFSQSAEEYFTQKGTEQNAPSQMDSTLALAHTHTGSCQWSDDDVQILLARAILNEGEEIEHTVLGEEGYLRAVFHVSKGQLNIGLVDGVDDELVSQLKKFLKSQFNEIKDLSEPYFKMLANCKLSVRVKNLLPDLLKVDYKGTGAQDYLAKISSANLTEILGELPEIQNIPCGEALVVTLRGRLFSSQINTVSLSIGRNPASRYFFVYIEVQKNENGELLLKVKEVGGESKERIAQALLINSSLDWKEYSSECDMTYECVMTSRINHVLLHSLDNSSKYSNGSLVLGDDSSTKFLNQMSHRDWVDNILNENMFRSMKPGESKILTLKCEFYAKQVKCASLSLGETPSNGYCNVYFEVKMGMDGCCRIVVKEIFGTNVELMARSLIQNEGIDWAEGKIQYQATYNKALEAFINDQFIMHIDENAKYENGGYQLSDKSAKNFLNRIKRQDWIENIILEQLIPRMDVGEELVLTVKVRITPDFIYYPSLKFGEIESTQGVSILIRVKKSDNGVSSVVLAGVDGTNENRVSQALFQNENLGWEQVKEFYPSVFFKGLESRLNDLFISYIDQGARYDGRYRKCISKNSASNFLSKIKDDEWLNQILEEPGLSLLSPGESLVLTIRGELHPKTIKSLSLSIGENPSSQYFHVYLEIVKVKNGKFKVVVKDVDGNSSTRVFSELSKNLALEFAPNLFHKYRVTQNNSERLLYSLSEFGRTELLNEIRRIQGVTDDDVVDVDSELLVQAALSILGRYSQDHSSSAWDDSDKRFSVTKALGDFLSGYRMDRELAFGVSQIIQRSFELDRERQIQTFYRVKRKAGVSPIAESGWEAFSPDLQDYLLDFSAQYFGAPTSSPAEELLRHPFNQMLGAAYYTLVDQGLSDLSHEILLHLYYQRRREDSLSEFYDGYQKQSGYDREYAIYNVQQDLKGFELAMSDLDLDVEEPFRIVEGTVAGASRFMWDVAFEKGVQQAMTQTARDIFPNHSFGDDDVLSNRLPQALFFEVQGRLCAVEYAALTASSSFEDKSQVLKLFLGLGADSILAFKRGYGSESMRADFIKLLHNLKTNHPKDYKQLLEDHYVYEKNVAIDGGMTIQPVTLRLGDILEGLLKGLKLSDLSGALRYFRLNFDSEEVESETDRIKSLLLEEGELSDDDQEWLADFMDAYTRPPKGNSKLQNFLNPPKGSRWYEVHQVLEKPLDEDDARRSKALKTHGDVLLELSV